MSISVKMNEFEYAIAMKEAERFFNDELCEKAAKEFLALIDSSTSILDLYGIKVKQREKRGRRRTDMRRNKNHNRIGYIPEGEETITSSRRELFKRNKKIDAQYKNIFKFDGLRCKQQRLEDSAKSKLQDYYTEAREPEMKQKLILEEAQDEDEVFTYFDSEDEHAQLLAEKQKQRDIIRYRRRKTRLAHKRGNQPRYRRERSTLSDAKFFKDKRELERARQALIDAYDVA